MSGARLEPCPRCGGKAKLKRGLPRLQKVKDRFALVQCLSCNLRTPTYHQRPGETGENVDLRAATAWNYRKDLR